MEETLRLVWMDLSDALLSMRIADFAQLSFVTMWVVILFMPLMGVDRRDPIAGFDFSLYAMASGAALVFALPQDLIGDIDLKTINTTLSCMALAALLRWSYSAQKGADKNRAARAKDDR